MSATNGTLVPFLAALSAVAGCGVQSASPVAFEGVVVHGARNTVEPGATAVPGATVCSLKEAEKDCWTTDASGHFELTLPIDTNVTLTFTAPGYGGIVVPITVGATDRTDWVVTLPSESDQASYYGPLGVWPSVAAGFLNATIQVMGWGKPTRDPTISIWPESGLGPIYDDASGHPDLSLRAVSSAHSAHFALVTPGEVDVGVSIAPLRCTRVTGWHSENSRGAPILAGFETRVVIRCEQQVDE